MITIAQCRAARGLLDWTQQDLADASGLSKTAINNFEKGHSDIKTESLRAIRMAFESADIEFLKDEGLRKKNEKVRILRGEHALTDLMADIFENVVVSGGEVQIVNAHETVSGQTSQKRLLEHHERMKQNNIKQRIICSAGNMAPGKHMEARRYLDQDTITAAMTTFLYGQKVAFELWDQSVIIIIDSAEAHQAELMRFEKLWQLSQPGEREDKPAKPLRKSIATQ